MARTMQNRNSFALCGFFFGSLVTVLSLDKVQETLVPANARGESSLAQEVYTGPTVTKVQLLEHAISSGNKYTEPLVVTAFNEHHVKSGEDLVASMLRTNPTMPILIFNLGLRFPTRQLINNTWCNSVLALPPSSFLRIPPEDPRKYDLAIGAWKPLVIQQVLDKVTSAPILFLDATSIVIQPIPPKHPMWQKVNSTLVLARPDSKFNVGNFTHPHTLEKMGVDLKDPRLSSSSLVFGSHLVVANNAEVRDTVLRPWVSCALDRDCIAPVGSQRRGEEEVDGPNPRRGLCSTDLPEEHRGNYRCLLHRGGDSVLSVILHELYYKLHKRFDWDRTTPQDNSDKGFKLLLQKDRVNMPPYYDMQGLFRVSRKKDHTPMIACSTNHQTEITHKFFECSLGSSIPHPNDPFKTHHQSRLDPTGSTVIRKECTIMHEKSTGQNVWKYAKGET